MIELEHVVKTYQRDDGTPVPALRDITCRIDAGEFVTIRGSSGSGKSSLLNILGCLDTTTSGVYRLAGEDVSRYTDEDRGRRCAPGASASSSRPSISCPAPRRWRTWKCLPSTAAVTWTEARR